VTEFYLLIGLTFCPIVALAAFLITYEGYIRGQNPDRKLALRMALKTSLFAFIFFAVLIAGIGFALNKIL
jgi:hypothetical protein